MIPVRLLDTIWATRKSDKLSGIKFMLAEVMSGSDCGKHLIVADAIGAGIGDCVIVTTGSSARMALCAPESPVDAAVIGIIDDNCKAFDK